MISNGKISVFSAGEENNNTALSSANLIAQLNGLNRSVYFRTKRPNWIHWIHWIIRCDCVLKMDADLKMQDVIGFLLCMQRLNHWPSNFSHSRDDNLAIFTDTSHNNHCTVCRCVIKRKINSGAFSEETFSLHYRPNCQQNFQ